MIFDAHFFPLSAPHVTTVNKNHECYAHLTEDSLCVVEKKILQVTSLHRSQWRRYSYESMGTLQFDSL